MHAVWGNRSRNPDIRVSPLSEPAIYWSFLERAKFCPVMGGFAPWSPRLTEAVFAGCVPVVFSSMLPPFSRLLDWSLFSVRVPSLNGIGHLREILARQDHAKLSANLDAASHALWYDLEGEHASAGSGMLPFLLVEMYLVSFGQTTLGKELSWALGENQALLQYTYWKRKSLLKS